MSFVQMRDSGASGIEIYFFDYQTDEDGNDLDPVLGAGPHFVKRLVATGLARNQVHTIKITMELREGETNDIVKVYVDGVQRLVGTSWEDYFRENEGGNTRPVDALMIMTRVKQGARPDSDGLGFYIDNIQIDVANAPAAPSTVNVDPNGHDFECDGSTTATRALAPDGKCAFKTISRGVDVVASGGFVNVAAGDAYAENVVISKPLTLKGARFGVDARTRVVTPGSESIIDGAAPGLGTVEILANDVVVDGFTITGGANAPNAGVRAANVNSGWTVANNIISDNSIGFTPSCASDCTIEKNLFDNNDRCPTCSSGGAGIYTDFPTTDLSITQNSFTGHDNNSSIILGSLGITHQSPEISQNHIHSNPGNLNDGPHTAVFLVKTNNATVTANRISQPNGPAISLAGGNTGANLQNNDLRDSHRGLRIEDVVGAGPNSGATVSNNAFGNNNTFGLSIIGAANGYTGTLTAANNWWGKASGPMNVGNPGGTGAVVDGNVTFTPFLVRGVDTDLILIGFQPNTTPVTTVHVLDPDATVVGDGSDSDCNGSVNTPFTASPDQFGDCAVKSIKVGADRVQAPGTPNTGIVSIGPGTYNELTITLIDKNNLTLRGSDANNRPHITNGLALADHTNLTLENLIISGIGRTSAGPPPQTYVVSFGREWHRRHELHDEQREDRRRGCYPGYCRRQPPRHRRRPVQRHHQHLQQPVRRHRLLVRLRHQHRWHRHQHRHRHLPQQHDHERQGARQLPGDELHRANGRHRGHKQHLDADRELRQRRDREP